MGNILINGNKDMNFKFHEHLKLKLGLLKTKHHYLRKLIKLRLTKWQILFYFLNKSFHNFQVD